MSPDSVQDQADGTPSPLRGAKDDRASYQIVLMVKHPTLQPDRISSELELQPEHGWMSGEQRRTPAARILPGLHTDSHWTVSKKVQSQMPFFEGALEFVELLERHRAFTRGISDSSGAVSIVVQLPGRANIGDEIGTQGLLRIASPNVSLGIEVFPDFDS